jgi:sialic acid synthase SpsE/quercetin dioxygenase-like cupin family protein
MEKLFTNLFIFELANNHQGDVNHGLNIIEEMGRLAKLYKINAAVKLQYRQLNTFIHPSFRHDLNQKHIGRFLSTELANSDFKLLVEAIHKNGMHTICTPFDEESVDLILEHGIEIIKIASCSADDWPLLNKVSTTNLPIIASTGGLSLSEIDNLYTFLSHRNLNFAILHCVGIYPSPNNSLNLNFLEKLIKRYPDTIIGYSGHERPDNYDVVKIAIAKGAKILERHVGLPNESVVLNSYSMNPIETENWIKSAIIAQEILGNDKIVSEDEFKSLLSLKRGVFAKRNIMKGELIKSEDVFFAMPCSNGQLTSGEFGKFRASFIASKEYLIDEPLFEKYEEDNYHKLRNIIHQAKGMLSEAGVVLSNNAKMELSHHYGISKFQEYGILIINLINREYCKKIIIILPGQKHPEQYHILKEETFHILQGEIVLTLNGIKTTLKKGEIITIERGVKHIFTSELGAIFEEISTTHYLNDSYYTDPVILNQDPMSRKTVLDIF